MKNGWKHFRQLIGKIGEQNMSRFDLNKGTSNKIDAVEDSAEF